jgi:hypothetical protein
LRTLTILLGLVLLIPSILFTQERIIGREYPEELPLGFWENWVETDDRSLNHFAYLAKDEDDMDRILRDELTENDMPLRQVHYGNPADGRERISLIWANSTLPGILLFQQIFEDRTDHDSFMYITKFTKNRMRAEGWKKMPKSFYPGRTSSKNKARRFHKELGRYVVFMHRDRDEKFLNSGGLASWIRFGPTKTRDGAIAKDTEKVRATLPEEFTMEMFNTPWQFLITRFNHPRGGVEAFFLVCEKNDDDSFTELLLVHVPDYVDNKAISSFKGMFYRSIKDRKWHSIPDKQMSTLSFYLADKSRLGKFFLFEKPPR